MYLNYRIKLMFLSTTKLCSLTFFVKAKHTEKYLVFQHRLNIAIFLREFRNFFNTLRLYQEPITRSLQLPHIPVTAFSQTDLFLV